MPRQTILTRKVDVKRIESLLRHEAKRRIRERLQCILWIYGDEEAQGVARKIGRCRQVVASYVRRFNEDGLRGLLRIGRGPGRGPALTKAHHAKLLEWIQKGPRAMGYSFNLWDCKRLSHHIYRAWGIRLSDERIRQILHELDARVLRPKYKLLKVSSRLRSKKNAKSKPFWRWPDAFPKTSMSSSRTK